MCVLIKIMETSQIISREYDDFLQFGNFSELSFSMLLHVLYLC